MCMHDPDGTNDYNSQNNDLNPNFWCNVNVSAPQTRIQFKCIQPINPKKANYHGHVWLPITGAAMAFECKELKRTRRIVNDPKPSDPN